MVDNLDNSTYISRVLKFCSEEEMAAFLDIIILLVIVLMIFYKLKIILGTRPENEREISHENAAKIIDILVKQQTKKKPVSNTIEGGELHVINDNNLTEMEKVLYKVPGFNKDSFLMSAKKAFEIILEAFSQGDLETLEPLLSKPLFKKFKEIIVQRKKDGITSETDFIGFNDAEIIDANVSKTNLVKIVVKFVSEQVNILKNSKGEVIEGDENFIQLITDNWTFERNINSQSPNWLLASTKK